MPRNTKILLQLGRNFLCAIANTVDMCAGYSAQFVAANELQKPASGDKKLARAYSPGFKPAQAMRMKYSKR